MEDTSKMKNSFKVLGLLALLLVAVAVVPAVSAVDFFFDKVEINDDEVDLSNPHTVAVERGETLDLHVVLHVENTTEDVEDLRLRTWIGGYEYDLIDDMSEIFVLRKSESSKAFDLTLTLPEDMEVEDDAYTLHVEVLNHNIEKTIPLSVEVEKTRHKLSIQDVLVSSSNVEAGDTVFVTVRLENTGDKKEEDIKVEVSALGVSAATYVDELASVEEDNRDEETSESTRALVLKLPADAANGDYDLNVKVTYNRGHSTVETVKVLHVGGAEADDAVKAIVSVDTTAQSVAQGAETVYKLTFANMGSEAQLFSANVAGAQLWADARVDPAFVSVAPGKTGEMYVYLRAHEDAATGNNLFTLQLLAGENLVKELPLGARVTESAEDSSDSVASGLLSSSTLKLGFVGLIVLLVIVGLVVALRKLKDDDEYPLEPKDGQTYY
jgi:uncharacterized membrane protein